MSTKNNFKNKKKTHLVTIWLHEYAKLYHTRQVRRLIRA